MLETWTLSVTQRLIRRSFLSPIRPRSTTTQIPQHWQASDPWKGNPNQGQPLASGSHPVELYAKNWHRFEWLRDMREYGGSQSRTLARRFVLEWIDQNQRWSGEIWHPQLLADRIRGMILTWGWFAASATTSQQQLITNSLLAQSIILAKDWRNIKNGNTRIEAISALMLCKAFLEKDTDPTPLSTALIEEVTNLIFSDGCHVTRQPDLHMNLLKSMIESRIGLTAMVARQDEPSAYLRDQLASLDDRINKMGAVARMWRHVNGHMIGILGSHELSADRIDDVLDRAGPKGRISNHANDGGFIRMASGRSVMLMNTGPAAWALPTVMAAGGKADAGALSIEFSNGQNMIFVNAGQKKSLFHELPDLANALAGTAAFSTLSVDRTNSADLTATDAQGRHAVIDHAETGPAPGGLLTEAKHLGYEKTHGLIHQRRVFLATGGNDLRGEDIMLYTGAPGHIPNEATVRFHLHPKITATMSIGGDVILKLPGSAAPWLFKAKGGSVHVEDSVVMGKTGLEKCAQITLTMPLGAIRTEYAKTVKWALRRQTKPRAAPPR